MSNVEVLLWSAGLLVLFVAITLVELVVFKRLGYDVVGHLQVVRDQGKTTRFVFEAFGVVAFVLVQPVVLAWLFSQISLGLKLDLVTVVPSFVIRFARMAF